MLLQVWHQQRALDARAVLLVEAGSSRLLASNDFLKTVWKQVFLNQGLKPRVSFRRDKSRSKRCFCETSVVKRTGEGSPSVFLGGQA